MRSYNRGKYINTYSTQYSKARGVLVQFLVPGNPERDRVGGRAGGTPVVWTLGSGCLALARYLSQLLSSQGIATTTIPIDGHARPHRNRRVSGRACASAVGEHGRRFGLAAGASDPSPPTATAELTRTIEVRTERADPGEDVPPEAP